MSTRIKIVESGLDFLVDAYQKATDKDEVDLFAKNYFLNVLGHEKLAEDYVKKYNIYKIPY